MHTSKGDSPPHKLPIPFSRRNKSPRFGLVRRREKARSDDGFIFFQHSLPGADDPTVYDNCVVEEHVAPSVKVFCVCGVENGATVSVAYDILVIIGQQVCRLSYLLRKWRRWREPVCLAVYFLMREVGFDHCESSSCISHCKSRPPHEILQGRGTVASKVASG